VVGVAARHGLVYRASLGFEPGTFPGYEHYRTLPHESLWGHHRGDEDEERDDAGGADGDEGRVEANDDDVAEGAQTIVFQVDDTPKAAKDAELIRKGKTWSLK
jgi:25S rRNA (uracil2634-N3)-methyltransferase